MLIDNFTKTKILNKNGLFYVTGEDIKELTGCK